MIPRTFFLILLRSLLSVLLLTGLVRAWAEPEFLEPEQAFRFSSQQQAPDRIVVTYAIADGYYMYRERFKFEATGATLGAPIFVPGVVHFDETFHKDVETYRHSVSIQIPVLSIAPGATSWTLTSHGQGCADQGLCYAPFEATQKFDSKGFHFASEPSVGDAGSATGATTATTATGATNAGPGNSLSAPVAPAAPPPASRLTDTLQSGRLMLIMPLFLILGLGLAFTPCVLPMVPILSSIIVGEGVGVSRRRGFILSLSYSLGLAIVYTALGVAAGLLGEGLAAALQNPWVLGCFGLLLAGLSLSMFDLFQLQVPSWLQDRLVSASGQQRSGKLAGVFMMGAISALIVGPCVAAPLASALLYISQTRNVVVGGAALFAMAIGMSVPLLLVGLSAGTLLPRAGRWMVSIKQLFGVLMLAMALWLVGPVLPVVLVMLGWAVLLIGYGVFLLPQTGLVPKVTAVLLCAAGLLELTGLAAGGRDVLSPLAPLVSAGSKVEKGGGSGLQFARIKSLQDLDGVLARARSDGKPVMLDFYADWCVACKEMEKFTFTDSQVRSTLNRAVLIQADVTNNDDNDKALLRRFHLFGPPGIIFFGLNAQESGRVIGFEKTDDFQQSLAQYLK